MPAGEYTGIVDLKAVDDPASLRQQILLLTQSGAGLQLKRIAQALGARGPEISSLPLPPIPSPKLIGMNSSATDSNPPLLLAGFDGACTLIWSVDAQSGARTGTASIPLGSV